MYEVILRFEVDALDEEAVVRPIFVWLLDSELFEPGDYDLNQKKQWRDFDLDRVVVDALTQRTQLVRIKGRERGEMAMIAMGKHGEAPTAVLRLAASREPAAIVDAWAPLFETVRLQTAILTSPAWRDVVDEAGIAWDADCLPRALVCGWPSGGEAPPVGAVGSEADGTPIALDHREHLTLLWLAPEGVIAGPAHRQALERLVTP